MVNTYLGMFKSHKPPHYISQEKTIEWLKACHLYHSDKENPNLDKFFSRFSVKPHQISGRYVSHPEVFQKKFDHGIFSKENVESINSKSRFYKEHITEVFEDFYHNLGALPEHIIHVSCTGYVSPSAAQTVGARAESKTKVTHAYHMGCYAAIPAIRMARAFVESEMDNSVDIVHTELCSLHMNPRIHTPEQIVIQTLFADGYIKYRLQDRPFPQRHFKLLNQLERIIPDSISDMRWELEDWGFAMTLSKEIPQKILHHLEPILSSISAMEGMDIREIKSRAIFAIHPGGPKIIDSIVHALDLREEQVQSSLEVLKSRGNMSSATLPHVWENLLYKEMEEGTLVISLAFGPGLSIFASLMEFRGESYA